ncbi:hypothetical protein EJ04DRAFT_523003 [Polyplosphaeria fusca]|uniref:Uncharacterized protein n=1 Tax=Polyplosphaeria fusca TaxID=682080 RepID=A0A9P4V0E1_9PLEO|nr:hypothetical protein EJ04DRAFT_523003 [Polyplosphaeria fusca]
MNGFPPPPMPHGPSWKLVKPAQNGKAYYSNNFGQTQWEKPIELKEPIDYAMEGTPWQQLWTGNTDDAKMYWHNPETSATLWDVPAEIKAKLEEIEKQPSRRPAPSQPNKWVAGSVNFLPSYDQKQNSRDDFHHHSDRGMDRRDRDRDENRYAIAERGTITYSKDADLYSNPKDAEAAFEKLLKRQGVQSDWSWEQTIRVGIKDPEWRAISDPKLREATFRKYCDNLRSQDKEKEAARQAKLRADFTAMLRSHVEITYLTRYKSALPYIQEESIFRTAKDDFERRQLYEAYIARLKQEHEEHQVVERKSALTELANLCKDLDLDAFTSFETVKQQLQEPKFKTLSHDDFLVTFEDRVRQLETDLDAQRKYERHANNRNERKKRQGLKKLLNELKQKGQINVNMEWSEVAPLIKEDPRYKAAVDLQGSGPVDNYLDVMAVFLDVMAEEDQKFRTHRRKALEILESRRFEVTAATTFEEFDATLRKDLLFANFDAESMRHVYKYILGKVIQRDEAERLGAEEVERRGMDDLRVAMRNLVPPITSAENWDDVRPRLEASPEFRVLEEPSRVAAFDKYIRRLKEKERTDRSDRGRRTDRGDRDRGDRDRDRDRDRGDRDRDRDRAGDRDRDRRERDHGRDRDYRNGTSESHRRRHGTRTRSPEADAYEAERLKAQEDRVARYRNDGGTGLSPQRRPHREDDRYERSRRGSTDHYGSERRDRAADREHKYMSRADPRDPPPTKLDYGDSRGIPARRRRDSDSENESNASRKRPRYSPRSPRRDRRSKTPGQQGTEAIESNAVASANAHYHSGSEEGEIEED